MGTLIVLLLLAMVIALIVRSMIRDKKNGKSLQCGGNCKCCAGCHQMAGPAEEKRRKG